MQSSPCSNLEWPASHRLPHAGPCLGSKHHLGRVAHLGKADRPHVRNRLPCPICASTKLAAGTQKLRPGSKQQKRLTGTQKLSLRQSSSLEPRDVPLADRFFSAVTGYPFPLGPFFERRTIRKEIDRGRIWTFEQEQALGFSNVTTVVRMTIIKLKSGGLWVHGPVAPTRECIRLIKELDAPVEFIVFPTFAYEHKIFVGPFSRKFPKAQVWIAPRQWSWPLPLPPQAFGIFPTGVIESDDQQLPWSDELEHKIFVSAIGGAGAGVGPYVEVVFLDKRSSTLLVTDAVVFIPDKPPEVVRKGNLLEAGGPLPGIIRALSSLEDPRGVKEKFFDSSMEQQLEQEGAVVLQGWKRMALQICYFVPGNLLNPTQSFNQLARKLVVSPVLQTLVYSKNSPGGRDWVTRIVTDWNFKRVIPAHFDAPVRAGPREFRRAFQFLWDQEDVQEQPTNFFDRLFGASKPTFSPPKTDMRALDGLESILKKAGVFE